MAARLDLGLPQTRRPLSRERRSSFAGVLTVPAAWRSSPPSRLPDRIASVFLFLPLFGKQIDYLLSV